jgi:hypothetical protein
MHSNLQPWQILLAALAGWVNRLSLPKTPSEAKAMDNRLISTEIGGSWL